MIIQLMRAIIKKVPCCFFTLEHVVHSHLTAYDIEHIVAWIFIFFKVFFLVIFNILLDFFGSAEDVFPEIFTGNGRIFPKKSKFNVRMVARILLDLIKSLDGSFVRLCE